MVHVSSCKSYFLRWNEKSNNSENWSTAPVRLPRLRYKLSHVNQFHMMILVRKYDKTSILTIFVDYVQHVESLTVRVICGRITLQQLGPHVLMVVESYSQLFTP